MSIDIGFTLKKAYEVLIKCPEMKIYGLLLFLNSMIMALYSYGAPKLNALVHIEKDGTIHTSPYLLQYVVISIIVLLITIIFSVIFLSATIRSTYEHLKGSSSSQKSIRNAVKVFPSVFGASILYALAVLSPILLGFFLLLTPCCLIVLLIFALMLYLAIRLAFFAPPIVIYRKKAIEGLQESWGVTYGNTVDVGVFLLILTIFMVPIYVMVSLANGNLLAEVIVQPISAFFNLWAIISMTLAYLQLEGIYGPQGLVESSASKNEPKEKSILLIGFSEEEVGRLRKEGLSVYPVNQDSKMFTLREILENPASHYGDCSWTSERYAIMHGFKQDEILEIIHKINSHAQGVVKYATSTEDSLDWTLDYLIKELGGKIE
jgi:hypothetical protein